MPQVIQTQEQRLQELEIALREQSKVAKEWEAIALEYRRKLDFLDKKIPESESRVWNPNR